MTEKKIDELLSSNYDGIQEYDNDLPRWWLSLFGITIVLSVLYIIHVHVLDTPTDSERLASELEALKQQQQSYQLAHAPEKTGAEGLMEIAKNLKRVEEGKTLFASRCAACHGASGEGVVGPNLTDEYSLHGNSIEAIYATIENGVPDKGMLAWKALMSKDELENVTAFVWSIRDLKLPGKAPQGNKEP